MFWIKISFGSAIYLDIKNIQEKIFFNKEVFLNSTLYFGFHRLIADDKIDKFNGLSCYDLEIILNFEI